MITNTVNLKLLRYRSYKIGPLIPHEKLPIYSRKFTEAKVHSPLEVRLCNMIENLTKRNVTQIKND